MDRASPERVAVEAQGAATEAAVTERLSARYAERERRFDSDAREARGAATRIGWLRLASFLLAGFMVWGSMFRAWGGRGYAGAVGLGLVFIALVLVHRRARRRLRRVELRAEFNRLMPLRRRRAWEDLPEAPPVRVPDGHLYARDLDLSGPASITHLLATCGTQPGWETLTRWLLSQADLGIVLERQKAVQELAVEVDLREALYAEANLLEGGLDAQVDAFLDWAEDPGTDARVPAWLTLAAYVLPVINVVTLVLYLSDRVPSWALGWPLAVSTLLVVSQTRRLHREFGRAGGGEEGVREYAGVLGLLAEGGFGSPFLIRARERLEGSIRPADGEIRSIRRWLDMSEVRRSILHIPFATLFLWDVHVVNGLHRWRERAGAHVRGWMTSVGEVEAVAALATLADAHPEWCLPTLDADADRLSGVALGHPLLPPDDCVPNDVEVGPAGTFLLVTGSNMSGKSTLLRAVGLNAVLASCGGPVAARGLVLPPVRVMTSMRVDDSLAGGVSFFMAELRRLKLIVDAAEADEPGLPLFLLDEILQGTNTAERRVAARVVVARLVRSGALGAVTTHDLTLAAEGDLEDLSVPVHFTEMVGGAGEGIRFDYLLRPGLAKSTNALKLLHLVGLAEGQ